MATATERAAIGAEEARLEGRGPVGRASEAAKNVATGRDDGLLNRPPGAGVGPVGTGVGSGVGTGFGPDGVTDRGVMGGRHHEGLMERTEEEVARLRNRTQITHEGEAYCPNPNLRDLPKEFETRVQVIQRYPEMRTVEKTDFVKEIHHEERTILVPKTRVIMDEVERIDRVPVVKQVPKIRIEIVHRVVTEEREVTDMVPVVEYVDVPRIEQVPRVITEEVEEMIRVPVVREVPVTRMVEVPTGNYCEAPAGEFVNPGHFDLLNRHHHAHKGGILHRTKSSSSSSSSDGEIGATDHSLNGTGVNSLDGTTTLDSPTAAGQRRKPGLLSRIIHH